MPTINTETKVEVSIEIEVFCNVCGYGLCHETETKNFHRDTPTIYVNPCYHCLEKAKEEGYDEGYDEGFDVGSIG